MDMTTYESRIGRIEAPAEKIYALVTDFRNFQQFLPEEQVSDWQADAESCSFQLSGMGKAGLRIIEKEPYATVKITGEGMSSLEFFLWIQLKEVAECDTRVKLTLKADLNPMLKMMAAKPIKQFLEMLVSRMESYTDY